MELRVESNGVRVNEWETEFLRTTLLFAVWHHQHPVESVHVRLDEADGSGGQRHVRCDLRAWTRAGEVVGAGATGADLSEAVDKASQLIEVALYAPKNVPRAKLWAERLAA